MRLNNWTAYANELTSVEAGNARDDTRIDFPFEFWGFFGSSLFLPFGPVCLFRINNMWLVLASFICFREKSRPKPRPPTHHRRPISDVLISQLCCIWTHHHGNRPPPQKKERQQGQRAAVKAAVKAAVVAMVTGWVACCHGDGARGQSA